MSLDDISLSWTHPLLPRPESCPEGLTQESYRFPFPLNLAKYAYPLHAKISAPDLFFDLPGEDPFKEI